jgi:phosphoserine phosphatase RsbX
MPILVGAAQRPMAGETICGDGFVTVPRAQGLLICLADGLGHGPAAQVASDAACRYVREHAEVPLERLMRGLNVALAATRGAAISLLVLDPPVKRALFVGIGNVELRAFSLAHIAPPTTPGIVGQGLRTARVWDYSLAPGDLFVLLSDGISSRFDLGALSHLPPQALADELVAKYFKSHDDACCVVARVALSAGDA